MQLMLPLEDHNYLIPAADLLHTGDFLTGYNIAFNIKDIQTFQCCRPQNVW